MTRFAIASASAVLIALTSLSGAQRRTPVYGYTVVNAYPHDPEAFTQGLIFRDGVLYESTGINGRSSLRKVRLETGDVLQRINVDARYFAEGLTDWGNRLIQLTYTTKVGFVYDISSFALQRTFEYTGQGWGLTHDMRRLIMSDGTPAVRFRDPDTILDTGRVIVMECLPVPGVVLRRRAAAAGAVRRAAAGAAARRSRPAAGRGRG